MREASYCAAMHLQSWLLHMGVSCAWGASCQGASIMPQLRHLTAVFHAGSMPLDSRAHAPRRFNASNL